MHAPASAPESSAALRTAHWLGRRGSWAYFSLGCLLLAALLSWVRPFTSIDRLLQDHTLAHWHRHHGDDIVIVELDERSLEVMGRDLWNRSLHARVLQNIAAQAPRCIGLDLPLSDRDAPDVQENALLAAQIERSGCVVLPMRLEMRGSGAPFERTPTLELARVASAIGHDHLEVDADGVVRSVYAREGFEGRLWPHFVDVLQKAAQADASAAAPLPFPPLPAPPGAMQGPWQQQDKQVLMFSEGKPPFRRISYFDVWAGHAPADIFTARYVLVGITAQGAAQFHGTPVQDKWAPRAAVEIYAYLLEGRIDDKPVAVSQPWQDVMLNLLPLTVLLLCLQRLRPWGMLALVLGLQAFLIGVQLARPWLGLQFSPAVGFLALLVVYPAWIGLRLGLALRRIRNTTAELNSEFDGFPLLPAPIAGGNGDFLDRQVSALSQAAIRMRDLHRFARDGLDHLPDPLLVLDVRAHVLIANRAALIHWGAADLAAQDAHALLGNLKVRANGSAMVPPGALGQSLAPRMGEATDDQERSLLVRCVPFFDTLQRHVGWMVALVDITRMRQAQSQRDEALRFISHDMREPMAAILTVLQLLRAPVDAASLPRMLERIHRHASTGLELADGFVNVARVEVQAFQPTCVDLVPLLQEAVDLAWVQGRARQVDVRITHGPAQACVRGDRSLLRRALANVMSNALKYSPTGGEVLCWIDEGPESWRLSVRDQGPGIPPELQSQLFVPFHRLHHESHPEVHGVGLGLLLVRTVMQRHGGGVQIQSAAGDGCCVSLQLVRIEPEDLTTDFGTDSTQQHAP
ncbi:CHASE2 and HATPase_c domain-containing protein [Xenophilus arseniciresistens]|uniref:histidine kinase n=1 Tax=Xenophilus arseniciresistens TaxID=1283306 RepID=A0AAE3NCE2_9BURK|nr:CHASE2 and HATPase_c domain-containing protein [Xenophilus arseniciresistens]MDA7418633.1 CHASE2 and HATPase_c domain-containing protein [Xenophilus arseniciresistens]